MNDTFLLHENKKFITAFNSSGLMRLIRNPSMNDLRTRQKLLDCIQVFSNYFQKIVMLRYVFCENTSYFTSCRQHLLEEFDHNYLLLEDRKNKKDLWDPILESCSSWFIWKMFTSDNDEKIVLVNFVLEASANVFFQEAHKVMSKFRETEYFSRHAELDQSHEELGIELLEDLTPTKQKQLQMLQYQGWDILTTMCDRIATIVSNQEDKHENTVQPAYDYA